MEVTIEEIHDINNKKNRRLLIFLMFIPCLIALKGLDNDIWFLLNHGRYVFENGIPYIEPFTIHKGLEFVMQQWLSACIFWITYSNFGAIGLQFLVMLCFGTSIFFMYKLCLKVSENFFISYSITIVTSLMVSLFMVTRPEIFSNLIFVLELYLMESYILSDNKKYLYFMPVLSILLINLHAAMWPMLFIILIPYILDSLKVPFAQGFEKKPLLLTTCSMLLVGFLNPYGIDAMTYLFRSCGNHEINTMVTEMRPPFINSVAGALVYCSMLIVILFYCFYRRGTTKLRYVLLTLGTAYMTISSVRGFLFFLICGVFPLAYYLKDLRPPVRQNNSSNKTLLLRKILIGLIVLSILFLVYQKVIFEIESNKEYKLLNETIQFILEKEDVKNIKLYTGYNDGGMTEFYGIPSYIDPRAEVFIKKNNKKSDIMNEYFQMQQGSLYYKDVLKKYQFTDLLVTKDDILYTYLKHDRGYKITFSNKKYTLFEKI